MELSPVGMPKVPEQFPQALDAVRRRCCPTRGEWDGSFQVKNIHDHVGIAVSQDNVCADYDALTIGRWGRQSAVQVDRNGVDVALQTWWKGPANDELPFQARG